uniref:Large ribosomal subunit protein uL22c n=1 Tax=Sphondylothamnion multifidum TaxID=193186 RepID=A0A4D6WZA6_9FLOR|nr:ribosomal protein L22 [Sphondylothamnion multifidum]
MNNETIQAKAIGKYIRLSTHKVRRVLEQIQGKNYADAKLMLQFMPYRACKTILKILDSAINNAKQSTSSEIKIQNFKIAKAIANKGPTMKRFQARAQGRAFPIQKPTCHIQITVEAQII